jgi:protoporphyrinogen oxidase
MNKKIIIIGAGPAGLTAGYELQKKGIKDITILESESQVGGISKTINYKENRIDIGGHRFFSKSDWVMNWWEKILPIESAKKNHVLTYQGDKKRYKSKNLHLKNSQDDVMLIRSRLSRIYFNRRFFDYPLKLNLETLTKLGLKKSILFGLSYMYSRTNPIKPEKNFEDFLINRFGKKLYLQFFKEYTEKVWGVACSEISAEWGAQRIKSLSISKALLHAFKKLIGVLDKANQTSLIENFVYPKYGPGHMWEVVAKKFEKAGGKILTKSKVFQIDIKNKEVKYIHYVDSSGKNNKISCTHAISSMPIKDLINSSKTSWSKNILALAKNLQYRDFITVGLLYHDKDLPKKLHDNWIYIQEPGVNVGRVQVFNNWSPYMVNDPKTIWFGLEFFCKETDPLWKKSEKELKLLAQEEMKKLGLVNASKAIDSVVIKVPKAYPGYFGEAYQQFNLIRGCLDPIKNLFLIGRNGMHRYNNQDHSMLTAKEASRQIISGKINKALIWDINVGDDYHEEKK